jgi:hypothetical protein
LEAANAADLDRRRKALRRQPSSREWPRADPARGAEVIACVHWARVDQRIPIHVAVEGRCYAEVRLSGLSDAG